MYKSSKLSRFSFTHDKWNINFVVKDTDIMLKLYKSLVRPKLEYCIQAWRPYLRKDVELLEKVQRRATKMIGALKDKSYHERLRVFGLTILETRRIRGDLIEVFFLNFKGFHDVKSDNFFT
jgi:ribonuclease P/MRP protein subunit RPP40